MILTCPSCFARYLTSADAIGPQGRDVRCGKCDHTWHQDPVRDSLDELDDMVAAMSPPPASPAQEKYRNVVADFAPHEEASAIPEGVKPLETERPRASAPPPKLPKEPSPFMLAVMAHKSQVSGVAAGIFAFLILASVVIAARAPISHAMPFMKPTFVALGVQSEANEKTMVFDSITAKVEQKTLTIQGSLINLSAETTLIPPLVIDLIDAASQTLKTLPAQIEQKELKGEEALVLNFVFPDIPDTASNAKLRFISGEEEGKGEDDSTTDEEAADSSHAPSEDEKDQPPAHE